MEEYRIGCPLKNSEGCCPCTSDFIECSESPCPYTAKTIKTLKGYSGHIKCNDALFYKKREAQNEKV